MYNDRMTTSAYEIRVCNSCGLRYPLVEGHSFGIRCPICMGETHVALQRHLVREAAVEARETDRRGKDLAVLLDNIRSGWNVGSILRSADGFGFTHVYLCGITPAADNGAVAKTSLGAEDSVPWSYHKDAVKLVKGLKAEGWKVYGLEEDARAISLPGHSAAALTLHERGVLIIGNEVTGVDPELLDLCDQIFFIPMRGEKKSFNVAIAFGIAAYALDAQTIGG
jgi:23S rRNA (guanosine2251-2'-O)-methyltransferase